jgi:hypothetical protein
VSDIEHWLTDEIVCPHCGYEHTDSWEANDGKEGDWVGECHDCEKPISIERHVTITYSTEKPE